MTSLALTAESPLVASALPRAPSGFHAALGFLTSTLLLVLALVALAP